jgi:hypothetical protein
MANLEALLAQRDRLPFDVRLNFTVLRTNVSSLPAMARMAQRLAVPLYCNLSTDRTFLFRHDEVTTLSRVERQDLQQALSELEAMARADRRWLPRFSDLRYISRHFDDVVQPRVPCAESQLKLLIHSTGGVGGCWAHDPVDNVRQRSIADIVASDHYRAEHARFFRKECVGCGSNYSLNLRWRPRTYAADLAWRLGLSDLAGG